MSWTAFVIELDVDTDLTPAEQVAEARESIARNPDLLWDIRDPFTDVTRHKNVRSAPGAADIAARLEYLRNRIHAECISMRELAELQSLAPHIEASDVELLEWAGVSEEDARNEGRI